MVSAKRCTCTAPHTCTLRSGTPPENVSQCHPPQGGKSSPLTVARTSGGRDRLDDAFEIAKVDVDDEVVLVGGFVGLIMGLRGVAGALRSVHDWKRLRVIRRLTEQHPVDPPTGSAV